MPLLVFPQVVIPCDVTCDMTHANEDAKVDTKFDANNDANEDANDDTKIDTKVFIPFCKEFDDYQGVRETYFLRAYWGKLFFMCEVKTSACRGP